MVLLMGSCMSSTYRKDYLDQALGPYLEVEDRPWILFSPAWPAVSSSTGPRIARSGSCLNRRAPASLRALLALALMPSLQPSKKATAAQNAVQERLSAASARKKYRLNLVPSPADDPTLAEPIQSFDDLLALAPSKQSKGKEKALIAGLEGMPSKQAVRGLLDSMEKMGWATPTPVQMQAIPLMLSVSPSTFKLYKPGCSQAYRAVICSLKLRLAQERRLRSSSHCSLPSQPRTTLRPHLVHALSSSSQRASWQGRSVRSQELLRVIDARL